jgi:hypothetical protein
MTTDHTESATDDGVPAADTESEADEATAVDDEDEDEERAGSVEDTRPPDRHDDPEDGNGTETVPSVELDLYDLSVRVSGQATDDLDAVEGTARSLMEYLVEQAHALEDSPDDRGLN